MSGWEKGREGECGVSGKQLLSGSLIWLLFLTERGTQSSRVRMLLLWHSCTGLTAALVSSPQLEAVWALQRHTVSTWKASADETFAK